MWLALVAAHVLQIKPVVQNTYARGAQVHLDMAQLLIQVGCESHTAAFSTGVLFSVLVAAHLQRSEQHPYTPPRTVS